MIELFRKVIICIEFSFIIKKILNLQKFFTKIFQDVNYSTVRSSTVTFSNFKSQFSIILDPHRTANSNILKNYYKFLHIIKL